MLYQQRKRSYARRGTVCEKDTEFQTEIQSHLVVDGDYSDSSSVTSLGADWENCLFHYLMIRVQFY